MSNWKELCKEWKQFNYNKEFGLLAEEAVKKWLYLLGNTVKGSEADENIRLDIDAYVNDKASSIKAITYSPTRKNRPGFELGVLEGDTWKPSWFFNGKAVHYYYISFTEFYVELWGIHKPSLIKHVMDNGFSFVTGLTQDIKDSQKFHKHKDTKVGFMNFETIKDNKIGKCIASYRFSKEGGIEELMEYLNEYK